MSSEDYETVKNKPKNSAVSSSVIEIIFTVTLLLLSLICFISTYYEVLGVYIKRKMYYESINTVSRTNQENEKNNIILFTFIFDLLTINKATSKILGIDRELFFISSSHFIVYQVKESKCLTQRTMARLI